MKQKILVIDDEPVVMEHMTRKLQESGYEVLSAANGKEALEITRKIKPSLILTDIIMPEMDGFSLIKKLKESDSEQDTPVIVFSGLASAEQTFREIGASDFLVKPFSDKDMLAKVHDALERSRSGARERRIILSGMDQPALKKLAADIDEYQFHVRLDLQPCNIDLIKTVMDKRPDILILDALMEPFSSCELIKSLRSFEQLNAVQILVYTDTSPRNRPRNGLAAQQLNELKERCLKAGASACIDSLTCFSFFMALGEF